MNTVHTYILRQKKIIQNGNVFVLLFLSMRNGGTHAVTTSSRRRKRWGDMGWKEIFECKDEPFATRRDLFLLCAFSGYFFEDVNFFKLDIDDLEGIWQQVVAINKGYCED